MTMCSGCAYYGYKAYTNPCKDCFPSCKNYQTVEDIKKETARKALAWLMGVDPDSVTVNEKLAEFESQN